MWSNVEEKINDGVAGISPNSSPSIAFVGTAETGLVNTIYNLGKRSNTQNLLGKGSLSNTIQDCQKNMGDDSILAIRAEGDIKGLISTISSNADNIVLGGDPLFDAEIIIEATCENEVFLMVDGVKSYLPVLDDHYIVVGNTGLSAVLPETISKGNRWEFSISSPKASLESLKTAVDACLELYTPEIVVICQDSSATDASYWNSLAENYFETDHKPLLFLLSSDLEENQNLDDAINNKIAQFSKVDARFVSVLCQRGEIVDGSNRFKRSPLGLLAATLSKCSVNQSIGATRYFNVPNYTIDKEWSNVHSRALDEARFISLRTYAGLNGIFWSNGRTLAGNSSDYRFIEIVRTVHKAIRLARNASLPYIHAPGDDVGLGNLLAEIRSALTKMTSADELYDFEVNIPDNQDVVNNGVQVEISLFGIPIIRKIILNFAFQYLQDNAS
ncbi:MAG: DUF2586 family protein [Brevinema sp.]